MTLFLLKNGGDKLSCAKKPGKFDCIVKNEFRDNEPLVVNDMILIGLPEVRIKDSGSGLTINGKSGKTVVCSVKNEKINGRASKFMTCRS